MLHPRKFCQYCHFSLRVDVFFCAFYSHETARRFILRHPNLKVNGRERGEKPESPNQTACFERYQLLCCCPRLAHSLTSANPPLPMGRTGSYSRPTSAGHRGLCDIARRQERNDRRGLAVWLVRLRLSRCNLGRIRSAPITANRPCRKPNNNNSRVPFAWRTEVHDVDVIVSSSCLRGSVGYVLHSSK